MARSIFFFSSLLLLSACAPTPAAWGFSVGAPAPPLDGCALQVLHLSPSEAERAYDRVGEVCIGYEGVRSTSEIEANDDAVSLLRQRACALGGDIVIAGGACSVPAVVGLPHKTVVVGAIQYHVFRARTHARR